MYCRNCGQEMDPKAVICVKCGVPKDIGDTYCSNCGESVHPNADVCVHCGAQIHSSQVYTEQNYTEAKSKLVAGLLGIFLGGFGIHNFYLGFNKKALIQLLCSTVGGIVTCGLATIGISIWGFVEGILILTGSIDEDSNGIPLKE